MWEVIWLIPMTCFLFLSLHIISSQRKLFKLKCQCTIFLCKFINDDGLFITMAWEQCGERGKFMIKICYSIFSPRLPYCSTLHNKKREKKENKKCYNHDCLCLLPPSHRIFLLKCGAHNIVREMKKRREFLKSS